LSPDAIKSAIKQVGDGDYEITLHEVTEASPVDPVARPTGDVTTYRVNDELPVRTDKPTRPPAGVQAESCGWPALMEKAIAAEDQAWDTAKKADWDHAWTTWHKSAVDRDRSNAGLGPSPDSAPTGYNRIDIGSTAYQRADLLAQLTGAGKPVLVGARGRRSADHFPNKIVPGHAYEVTKVEDNKIHMRNPWGIRHPDPMDAKTFWEYYRRYDHYGTRDGDYTTLKWGMMTSDLPDTIELHEGIPDHLGGGAALGGYSYLDDQGRLKVDMTVNDNAGERDIQCHEGDSFEFAGATWQVTKIFETYTDGRPHVATLSRVE
jgi:hypothetical protein